MAKIGDTLPVCVQARLANSCLLGTSIWDANYCACPKGPRPENDPIYFPFDKATGQLAPITLYAQLSTQHFLIKNDQIQRLMIPLAADSELLQFEMVAHKPGQCCCWLIVMTKEGKELGRISLEIDVNSKSSERHAATAYLTLAVHKPMLKEGFPLFVPPLASIPTIPIENKDTILAEVNRFQKLRDTFNCQPELLDAMEKKIALLANSLIKALLNKER